MTQAAAACQASRQQPGRPPPARTPHTPVLSTPHWLPPRQHGPPRPGCCAHRAPYARPCPSSHLQSPPACPRPPHPTNTWLHAAPHPPRTGLSRKVVEATHGPSQALMRAEQRGNPGEKGHGGQAAVPCPSLAGPQPPLEAKAQRQDGRAFCDLIPRPNTCFPLGPGPTARNSNPEAGSRCKCTGPRRPWTALPPERSPPSRAPGSQATRPPGRQKELPSERMAFAFQTQKRARCQSRPVGQIWNSCSSPIPRVQVTGVGCMALGTS